MAGHIHLIEVSALVNAKRPETYLCITYCRGISLVCRFFSRVFTRFRFLVFHHISDWHVESEIGMRVRYRLKKCLRLERYSREDRTGQGKEGLNAVECSHQSSRQCGRCVLAQDCLACKSGDKQNVALRDRSDDFLPIP
jgi:hypothetical protein